MLNLNIVFHLASLLGFLGLLYWLSEVKTRRDLLLLLMKSHHQKDTPIIRVDWPLNFFARVSSALKVTFDSSIPLKSVPSCKIRLNEVSAALQNGWFRAIRCKPLGESKDVVISFELHDKDKVELVKSSLIRAVASDRLKIEVF